MLNPGEPVHIITRKRFDEDVRRHFIGVVDDAKAGIARITGYGFIFDTSRNEFERHECERTRIYGLADAGYIVTILPEDTDIGKMRYQFDDDHWVLTDGTTSLDIHDLGLNL